MVRVVLAEDMRILRDTLAAVMNLADGIEVVAELAEAEPYEEVIGTGAQHAVGELTTCPFCLAQWVATGLVFGAVFAPRSTRLVTSLFTALVAGDALQFGYDALQNESD